MSAGSNSANTESSTEAVVTEKDPFKIYNLMGEEPPNKELAPDANQKLEANLLEAQNNYNLYPDSLESIIWYGRRLAFLGRYLHATDVYTSGLEKFPTSYTLRRHRGHRYISTRQLSKAIEDFEMAAFIV